MKSMTGYGASQRTRDGVAVEVSLRAVNGRFLDVKVHLPTEYQAFEKDVRDCLSQTVRRGSISAVIVRKRDLGGPSAKELVFDEELATQWVAGLRKLGRSLKLKGELGIESLAGFETLVQIRDNPKVKKSEKDLLVGCVTDALERLETERQREGQKLQKDIEARLKKFELLRLEIESHRSEANDSLQRRLEKRIEELQIKNFDAQRVADEVVWLLEKGDIEEELTRLKEHIRHFQGLIKSSENEGKKLDFYTQELLREVNTIGSKANHTPITQAVIEAKTLIEQIKEQVQNIE